MMTTTELGSLVGAFSVTHIGLSAVRESLIDRLGGLAARSGVVGSGARLPSFWLADSSGYEVWPDEAIAGRQIYRAAYTAISSALLFPALAAYPELRATAPPSSLLLSEYQTWLCFGVAAVAQGISLSSLVNPSPLSLVPAFEADEEALLGIKRDDELKLAPIGLTRITRHPLILPVVPWGMANALLAGGHMPDYILFCGLAVYALAGCKAQDLRVEASNQVGTVFRDGALQRFYRDTSYAPFGAILDGRQDLRDAMREVPLTSLGVGIMLGACIEWATLEWWVGVRLPF